MVMNLYHTLQPNNLHADLEQCVSFAEKMIIKAKEIITNVLMVCSFQRLEVGRLLEAV